MEQKIHFLPSQFQNGISKYIHMAQGKHAIYFMQVQAKTLTQRK